MDVRKKVLLPLTAILTSVSLVSTTIPANIQAADFTETGYVDHQRMAREAAAQGMVLLKNDKQVLPLSAASGKVAVFGMNQIDYVPGGGGSAAVNAPYTVHLLQGLKNNPDLQVYEPLADAYQKSYDAGEKYFYGKIDQMDISGYIEGAKAFTDTAIISIGRAMGEASDISVDPVTSGDKNNPSYNTGYYLTPAEKNMVDTVCGNFDKVIVVLNTAAVMDSSWYKDNDKIQAVLAVWTPGMEGGNAIADVLTGKVNPSGRLVDTMVKSYRDYPSAETFDNSEYQPHSEDIYNGYRYFETIPGKKERVNYEFGFGLSYTTFALSGQTMQVNDGEITVGVTVKNTGSRAGREVVQVYYSAPQGKLGKAAKELAAFEKTKELKPGESQTLTMSFPIADMASFDDAGKTAYASSYVLEKGDYAVYVGTSVADQNLTRAGVYHLDQDTKVGQTLDHLCAPTQLPERLLADGTYEPIAPVEKPTVQTAPHNMVKAPESPILLSDVYQDPSKMDAFLAQLTVDQLAEMTQGQGSVNIGDVGGIGFRIPQYQMYTANAADGPAGMHADAHLKATWFPCATLLACTWDTGLLEEIGAAVASELKDTGIDIWLAPSLNIHRDPRNGRNFEYFSEDPLISGKMAAAEVRGAQGQGIAAVIKHFAGNNKETNRGGVDTRVSERALREIYLRGFKMVIDEADPWAIMTSYNRINGTKGTMNKELIEGILRNEWGYDGLVMTDWNT